MGVELGKVLAKNILAQLGKPEDVTGHDSSVRIACALRNRRRLGLIGVCDRQRASSTTIRSTGRSDLPLGVHDTKKLKCTMVG